MPFKRELDASFPVVYEQWEAEGAKWTIQDLAPEDLEEAMHLFTEADGAVINEEMLCRITGVSKDPVSHDESRKFWRDYVIPQRVTLACYHEKDGERRMIGLNGLLIKCRDDPPSNLGEYKGKAWKPIVGCLTWVEGIQNLYEVMGVDRYLSGCGLLVLKEFRGRQIATKILNAREPLCKRLGVSATATIFTGVASAGAAAKSGFSTLLEVTLKEMADAGLEFPRDDRTIKLMWKKF